MPEEEVKPGSGNDSDKSEAAQVEGFIINPANGNGINPNPIESGNSADWKEGSEQKEQYKSDATDE